MPTAQEFMALGRGNGFPFCVKQADNTSGPIVGGGVWGSTELTLAQIMHVYWNLSSISYTISYTDDGTPVIISGTLPAVFNIAEDEATPIKRICNRLFFVRPDGNFTANNLSGIYTDHTDAETSLYRFGAIVASEYEGILALQDIFGLLLLNSGIRLWLVGFDPSIASGLLPVSSPPIETTGAVPVTLNGSDFNLWFILQSGLTLENLSVSISLDFYTYT